ncbi:hypothetical protein Vretimale_9436 [Volvox reticuliferus]|uniref:Protein phosphatase n=1 Tax=Volvox reticuliferus TaxID=1737510 RepID=A0A8J4LNS6_9CHLO|nr:hypothetical protein Vretifemale_9925 [Volvox reticuliferus]GIM04939.1 hypothetical protein Vretimale_9436 [Volvox reticuliferus]
MAARRIARLLGPFFDCQVPSTGTKGNTTSGAALAAWSGALAFGQRRAWLSQAALQHAPAHHTYTLTITTGNLRGAGSLAPAWLQLVGTHGKSERIIVGETEEDRLARGSVRTVSVTAQEDLGQVRFVNVQRLGSSISDAGTGWFLEHVVVRTPERQRLYFPCHAWFGEADCGGRRGPLERNLLPVAPEDDLTAKPVQLSASGVAVPHPDKVKHDGAKGVNRKGFGHGGEDAYFYCSGGNTAMFGLGVADGVFMWRELGIDSGDFSRALMRLARDSVLAGSVDVVRVMQDAASGALAAGVQGSSTACVVLVNQETGQLFAANLGDSGCLLLRPAANDPHAHAQVRSPCGTHATGAAAAATVPHYYVKFRTNQLEHDFGRPYQLGHHPAADAVDRCDVATQSVRPGDVLVLGTDGLYDNLSDVEIADEVAACRAKDFGPMVIAQRLARMAFEASYDKHRRTPYAASASEHFDMVYSGGKPDDITVLCAVVE